MGEPNNSMYRLQPGRNQQGGSDLTPHSAVSSFNLPAAYDSSLITPVSMTSSPHMSAKTGATTLRGTNLSPLMASPTSYQLGWEGDGYSPTYLQQCMKQKDRSGALHIPTTDSFLPPSPSYVAAPNIYYGNYGVSTPAASPNLHQSPQSLQQHSPHASAGGMSNNSYHSMSYPSPNESLFRQSNQAPILIAPNPTNRRVSATIKHTYESPRQDSISMTRSPTNGQATSQGQFPEPLVSQTSRGKKSQKRKNQHTSEYYDRILASGDLNDGEQLLITLTRLEIDWKEVAKRWSSGMNQKITVAALQMRRKRLLEKLRDRALVDSVDDYDNIKSSLKWDYVKEGTPKGRGREPRPRRDDEKRFQQGQDGNQTEDFETRSRSSSDSHSSWSYLHGSPGSQGFDHGETASLVSALSTASMDEVRSRETSDASTHYHVQVQQSQQQDRQRQANAAMFAQQVHRQHQHQHHNQHRNQQNHFGHGP